jgi:hypothetical protein
VAPDEPDALLSEARELTQVDRLLVGEALSDDAVLPSVGVVTAIGLAGPDRRHRQLSTSRHVVAYLIHVRRAARDRHPPSRGPRADEPVLDQSS